MPYPTFAVRRIHFALFAAGVAAVAASCHRADTPLTVVQAPTFTSIAPDNGLVGSSVPVVLGGTNFVEGGTTVTVHGTGLQVTGVTVVSSSTITATLVIDGTATLASDTLWVSTPGGNTGGEVFTVRPNTATLATVAPNIAVDSTTVAVTMIGRYFVSGGTNVTFTKPGITADSIVVQNDTMLTANFVVATNPTTFTTYARIQTIAGLSDSVPFKVTAPLPRFTGMTPTSALQGTSGSLYITGANFILNATTLAATGTGVHFSGIVATSDTTVGATYGIDADATLGPHTVTVTTTIGSNPAAQSRTFTVVAPVPTLASVSPISGSVGTTVAVTLAGGKFQPGAGTTVTVSDPAISVTNVSVTSASSLTANFVIAPNATPGNDTVIVSTVGGTSDARVFAVAAHGSLILAYTGGVQTFTVPAGYTSITITALGAGGGSPGGGVPGGNGAGVTGTFSVTPGSTLTVIVGGGGGGSGGFGLPGGGGGTFVFDASSSLLIAAGGGGGGCVNCAVNSPDAVFTTAGAAGTGAGGAGGVAGSGGAADTVIGGGGGGGGTISGGAGIIGQYNAGGGGVNTASGGGAGGETIGNSGATGFATGGYGGGGGGGHGGGGGGGGFSGGGGGGTNAQPGSGGGGGSFNGGTNQSTTTGGFAGGGSPTTGFGTAGANGWVIIVW